MLGCAVTEADNGRSALERVREHPDSYDLVLMAVTMPEMSGLEQRSARGLGRPVPAPGEAVFGRRAGRGHSARARRAGQLRFDVM